MAGEQIVTLTDNRGYSTTIWCTKLDHNLDKPIININMPSDKNSMSAETAPTTLLIDLGRVKEIITLQGFLVNNAVGSAKDKKDILWAIAKYSRTQTLTWGTTAQQSVSGNINKIMVTETPGMIVGTANYGNETVEKGFAVQLGFMISSDK